MAKGLRSSVRKRNKAKLRATVFGPAVDARTERLSVKLQELASQPRPKNSETANMESNGAGDQGEIRMQTEAARQDGDMDIDEGATKVTAGGSSSQRNRIRKRSTKKSRSSIVFAQHPQKLRRMSKKR
ncbi:hypothetical protein VTN00DRAFT_8621 [Thermoascus crustaceus]|uniref:uncharacterized protein n=1 Tax=Thermoascus crustaceus TaxID=5088 RepID=UPI00374451FF